MANNSINIAGFFFAGLALVITPLRAAESKITSAEEAKLGQEEIRRERHGIKGGRRESSRDLKNGANNEKLTQDRNEMAPDKAEINGDGKDLHQDRVEQRQDVAELHSDRRDTVKN